MNSIELLEPRIAPAILTPTVSKGVLLIEHNGASGTAENLTIAQTGPNSFTVADSIAVANFGPFAGVKSIVVKVTDLGDQIDFDFSHDGLAGALDITTTGGTNAITLGSVDLISGLITGKVTVHGGSGPDSLAVEDGIAIAAAVRFDGGADVDTFTANDAYLAKKLTLDSVENITTQNASSPVVIGGMLVENEDANGPVVFILSQIAAITGPLTYCGSATVTDSVTLNGQFSGPVKLMLLDGTNNVTTSGSFASSLSVTAGTGSDTVDFKSVSGNLNPLLPPFITANVAGPLALKLGNGTNTVTFADGSYFAKDIAITTGTGMDTVNFTKFIAAKNVTLALGNGVNTVNSAAGGAQNLLGGNFKFTGGADADTVDLDDLVAGNLNVNLGNGVNNVSGSARITGKSASFAGGSGVDTISLRLASSGGKLTAKLGAGVDSFTFLGGALASATLDGGADTDTLTGQPLLPAKQKISKFEAVS